VEDESLVMRHLEKEILFELLVAEKTTDYSRLKHGLLARMESGDVTHVEYQFNQWKAEQKAQA